MTVVTAQPIVDIKNIIIVIVVVAIIVGGFAGLGQNTSWVVG